MLNNKPNAKILNFWAPDQNFGDPIGLIATTFTFDAEFFENECLYRFVKMESDAEEDGPIYLVEREEKLNGIKCSIIVDQNHLCKNRNLRWDVIPIRLKKGVLHAKISLLYWSNCIRLIISSANITNEGYRKNKEIFGVIDLYPDSVSPLKTFNDILEYLETIITTDEYSESIIKNKPIELINNIRNIITSWNITEINKTKHNVHIYPLLIKPNGDNFFDFAQNIWEQYSINNPPSNSIITSPFFDSPNTKNEPSIKIWEFLRKRGQASVQYNCSGADVPTENKVFLNAPITLLTNIPTGRKDVSVSFCKISELDTFNNKPVIRPVHAKSYYIEGDNGLVMFIIGSSNFTSNGLGLNDNCNYEANLIYIINRERDHKLYKEIEGLIIKGTQIDTDKVHWQEQKPEDECKDETSTILHAFFKNAIVIENDSINIKFSFNNVIPPEEFRIMTEKNEELYNIKLWEKENKPNNKLIEWNDVSIPSGFNIFWKGIIIPSYLPLNLSDYTMLPTPEALKNLPIDVLSNILTSAKPAYLIIKNWQARNKKKGNNDYTQLIDPHKRIVTNNFLLQRTRKYSLAINSIKRKLEQPIYNSETLEWRINGPIGIKAFLNALLTESKSLEEKLFFMSEILLCLKDLTPIIKNNSISRKSFFNAVNDFIKSEIENKMGILIKSTDNNDIKNYSNDALNYTKEIFQKSI